MCGGLVPGNSERLAIIGAGISTYLYHSRRAPHTCIATCPASVFLADPRCDADRDLFILFSLTFTHWLLSLHSLLNVFLCTSFVFLFIHDSLLFILFFTLPLHFINLPLLIFSTSLLFFFSIVFLLFTSLPHPLLAPLVFLFSLVHFLSHHRHPFSSFPLSLLPLTSLQLSYSLSFSPAFT